MSARPGHDEADQEQSPRPASQERTKEEREKRPREVGGPAGPDPTRYGDWERNGRCYDF